MVGVALAACSSSGTELSMTFSRGAFYDAPFPSDDLRGADGRVDLARIPNPTHPTLMEQALDLLARVDGFAQTGAIYFRASAALDPRSLPDLAESTRASASVFLVSIDPTRDDYLRRRPIDVAFLSDGGPFGAPNLLALLPLQGLPLGGGETYAAVVTTAVRDHRGAGLRPSNEMADLAHGRAPAGLGEPALDHYRAAMMAMTSIGVDSSTIAAITVFTTENATAELERVVKHALARPAPAITTPVRGDTFTDYCVFDAAIDMPVYQSGMAPYMAAGGAWTFDGEGVPIVDHLETARVVFTIPRGPTPPNGWPLVVFVRTGGGGDRPLVDRGVCATSAFSAPIDAGSGPARDLAQIGFAAVQVDGPLGGMRNRSGADEEITTFNLQNGAALRDNVRQGGVELALFSHVVREFAFDATSCPGAGSVTFDRSHVAVMGHSMGAWIAPLALAADPTFGAAVLSGAGGSFLANMLDKQKPADVSTIIAFMLHFQGRVLERHDPALTLLQWASEPADPQVYAPRIVRGPQRSVLMLQGVIDHYILPSIANSLSLSLGLDEAGPAYDGMPELRALGQTALVDLLPLAGRTSITLPTTANIDAKTTAVVVQHPADAIEDGHEAMFQTEAPKHQYRCFLASWLTGAPVVPADGAQAAPCN
jgi:hypothetical protein